MKAAMSPVRLAILPLALGLLTATPLAQERLPPQVAGTWKITRVLTVPKGACWTEQEARPLLGSLLHYAPRSMRWQGGTVALTGVVAHPVNENDLAAESNVSGTGHGPALAELGIRLRKVMEVNMQHDDADITGATTEVPGDAVLVAGPGRIVVSACGVYMEARRPGAK